MSTCKEAEELIKLKEGLESIAARVDTKLWLVGYIDTRGPLHQYNEVYLVVGHRSIRSGNPLFKINRVTNVFRVTVLSKHGALTDSIDIPTRPNIDLHVFLHMNSSVIALIVYNDNAQKDNKEPA